MKEVAKTQHLIRRGGTWYYHRRVPPRLVAVIGKKFIKQSLRTDSLAEAKRLRTIHDLNSEALFASAERGERPTASQKSSRLLPLATLSEHVKALVERLDSRSADSFASDPPADDEDLRERRINAETELGILIDASDPRRGEWIQRTTNRVLSSLGVDWLDPETAAKLTGLVSRALLEVCRRKIDRYNYDFSHPYHDHLFDPRRPPATRLRDLGDLYLDEKREEFRLNGVSAKRLDKIRACVETICEILGEATHVHAIGDDEVQTLRSVLAQIPTNRAKHYPKLPVHVAVERGKKDGRPLLSSVTQAVYLDAFREMLKVAVRKKHLANNPALDARPLKKDAIAPQDKRRPWTDQQIREFFTGTFYQSCGPCSPNPYSGTDRHWRFWLPLLMLFSGARPNEICQLSVHDIRRSDAGVWFMSITDQGEGNSLKTEGSRRRVPIHPELIRLGLLSYVNEQSKGTTGGRIFPTLKPNKYGNLAWYPLKRFNERFVRAEIELGERQSLYSLRHSVRDALRRAKAPPETLLAVGGWSPAGKAVSDHYGDPGNPDLHAEYVEKIRYPGLNLDFLYRA